MDKHLTWKNHINNLYQRVHYTLRTLYKLKNFLSVKQKTYLVQTLIFPLFDYCDVIYNDMSAELSRKIQRLHNTCVRFVFNLKYYDHITPYLHKLGWLPLHLKRELHILCRTYSILRTETPDYLFAKYTYLSAHGRNTRGENLLLIPKHHTVMYEKSFLTSSTKLWNNIPARVRDTHSRAKFKLMCTEELHKKGNNDLILPGIIIVIQHCD